MRTALAVAMAFVFCIAAFFFISDRTPAASESSFDARAFNLVQQSGRPVLIDVYAKWCSTCRAQDAVLNRLLQVQPYNDVAWMRVDYDRDKEFVRSFRARSQGTLILFKDGKEIARAVGETREERLRAMLERAN